MQVRYEESFEKDLKAVKDSKIFKRLKRIIDEVKNAENLSMIKNIKKLKGYDTYFRIRMGDYRVGIEVVGETVIFVRFLHRRDVYKYFP
ncbi:MAG: type II toxin-antitoxin system RelE/ParE family toxin [Calditrichaeota bacterium]|nr:type II toxin-antitoxin system RelE/ParE family toxin [Calditrichota bacterium]MCB0297598.1 type II toxin-antitoxin system RelE/ParE family toxin [Calditrichota bacterium]MCB0304163.1 type II toxin-antitoxin system RelE/ParE family toxin [Calditrichota bacterium]MCB0313600.1 type II toxin-antitoxin system RelE/ParE family toxin [Calditrichota bacterium]MCB9090478.1 type II toxin-antitoxin system RelE/ParE family toxin [Calditrichia bacterium]